MKIEIELLSGPNAPTVRTIDHFPCVVGRASGVSLRLELPGLWDRHFQLEFQLGEGLILTPLAGGFVAVNGQQSKRALLRNGDLIEAGGAKMRFWLARTCQRSYRAREWFFWVALAGLCLGQVLLIYKLMP